MPAIAHVIPRPTPAAATRARRGVWPDVGADVGAGVGAGVGSSLVGCRWPM